MTSETSLQVLLGTAASIAFLHTVVGVDHTLPFVALGRARGWTLGRVLLVTALCGAAHVLSSVLLGMLGIGLGAALEQLQWIQTRRGELAAWLLIAFGSWLLVRASWKTFRQRVHSHDHVHADGSVHTHPHDHANPVHRHPHAAPNPTTVWTLFIIFAFGPCEPLVPLLMAPAALHDWARIGLVAGVYGAVTIASMLVLVGVGHAGARFIHMPSLERHADSLAGATIALSGVAIQVLGI